MPIFSWLTGAQPVVGPDGVTAIGGDPVIVSPGQFALAVSTGGTALTIPGGATHARITNDSSSAGNIRFFWDITSPDSTHGHVLAPGDTYEFDNLAALKIAAETSGVIAQVTYLHY